MSAMSYKLVNEESVSAVTASPSVSIGTRRLEGGREYLYACNGATHTAAVGYCVIASAMSGGSFTVTAVGGEIPMGVVMHAAIPGGSYGWLMTRGIVHGYSGSAIAFGKAVIVGALGTMEELTSATAGVVPVMPIGTAITAIASAGTGAVLIRAL